MEEYRCLACGHEFGAPSGQTECPVCGHLYVRWLTYEVNFGPRKKKRHGTTHK